MAGDTLCALLGLTTGVGSFVALALTGLGRRVAPRFGLLDRPDGRRKAQPRPVPVAGGPAVFLAALASIAAAAVVSPDLAASLAADLREAVALLVACAVVVAVGMADDRYNLRPANKVAGQLVAILILVGPGGFVAERVGVFHWSLELGNVAVPVTAFGLLVCVNAFNLIDGMDGMLATVGLISLLSLGLMAALAGHALPAAAALSLAGALVGFLWFNFPPATVYMGDSGSMLVGLVAGAVAVPASLRAPGREAVATAAAILVLPMTDLTAAVVRRALTGRGLTASDRSHLHHVLQRRGFTVGGVLALVAALGAFASAGAFASTQFQSDLYALVAAGGVVALLMASGLFGGAELRLVAARVRAAVRGVRNRATPRAREVRLEGTADWGSVWKSLVASAERHQLRSLCLDVNAPLLGEDYHASWEPAAGAAESEHWRLEFPLHSRGRVVGRLIVAGWREESVAETFLVLARMIGHAEVQVATVAPPPPPAHAPAVATVGLPSANHSGLPVPAPAPPGRRVRRRNRSRKISNPS